MAPPPVCTLPFCGSNSPFDSLYTFSSDLCGCNGNGNATSCQTVGYCVCNPDWSGRADFSNVEYSCHIYEPAIVALWSLVIASVLLTYLFCGNRFYELIRRFLATRRRMHAKGKPYSLHNNRGLWVLIILFCSTLPAILGTAIVRLADSQQRIALSWLMSTGWFIVLCTYYLAMHKYNTALATSALKAEQASGRLVARYRWIGRAFFFVLSCSLSLCVPVYANGGITQVLSRGCMIGYLAWVGLALIAFSFFLAAVRNHIVKVLSQADENKPLLERMTRVYNTCIFASRLQAAVFILLAVIPVLWTTHDYILPMTFLIIPYVTWRFIQSIYQPQQLNNPAKALASTTSLAKIKDSAEGDYSRT